MNRRTFTKLFAGTVTAAGISRVNAAEGNPSNQVSRDVSARSHGINRFVPPSGGSESWEYVILDAAPPHMTEVDGTAVADIDGDGKTEVIIPGNGALLWYRPSTSEKGVVARGQFSLGVTLEDIDRDGRKEIVTGKNVNLARCELEKWALCWYKSGPNLQDPWTEHVLDGEASGYPHDILFGDLDGDGQREMVANACYSAEPGLFIYKVPADPRNPWKKQVVQLGRAAEGSGLGDLDGDGKEEIVMAPYWFSAPRAGAFSGQPWKTHSLAPGFRELSRASVFDVNGDGLLDVVVVESDYHHGRLSWFENRVTTDAGNGWIEHEIDAPLKNAHSLIAWRDAKTKQVNLLVGEMNQGGWADEYNWDARLIKYTTLDGGMSWRSEVIYQGEGTHEARLVDLDGSGTHVLFGHSLEVIDKTDPNICDAPDRNTGWVQMFRPLERPSVLTQYKHVFVDRDKPSMSTDIHAIDVDGDGRLDIVCGAWWYQNPTWERHVIPGVAQIINAYDLDKDGRQELIGIKPKSGATAYSLNAASYHPVNTLDFYSALCSDLVWLKPNDLSKDLWEEHSIGTGDGDWPHGSTIGPLLPGGRVALVCGYHDHAYNPPQIFELPEDPKQHPWKKWVAAEIPYGEEMIAYDLDGDGKLDIVAGPYWLENLGDGRFEPHLLIDPEFLESADLDMISRIAIADVNGDGRTDILFTVQRVEKWQSSVEGPAAVDYPLMTEEHYRSTHKAHFGAVGWLENTGNLAGRKFDVHIIDRARSPHSIGVGDLDGDGEMEVIVGEHDPFCSTQTQCRLYAYKKADAKGLTWSRHPIDNRFDHYNGAKVVEFSPGRPSIISQGDSSYVHIWERGKV